MQTNLQNWVDGKRLTVASGGVTEGYAVKLDTAGKATAMNDTDDIAIGIAADTYAAAAEGIFYPWIPGQEIWVSVTAATAVGDKMVLAPGTGRFAPSTATGALVSGIALSATAGAGFAKVLPVSLLAVVNIAE